MSQFACLQISFHSIYSYLIFLWFTLSVYMCVCGFKYGHNLILLLTLLIFSLVIPWYMEFLMLVSWLTLLFRIQINIFKFMRPILSDVNCILFSISEIVGRACVEAVPAGHQVYHVVYFSLPIPLGLFCRSGQSSGSTFLRSFCAISVTRRIMNIFH